MGFALCLMACTVATSPEQTTEIVTTRPTAEATIEATVTPNQIPSIPSNMPELPTAVAPTLTPETAEFSPRFDRFLASMQFDPGSNTLAGLIKVADSWQHASVAYPPGANFIDSDYAPATDRLLAWGGSGAGAGVASLAAGNLAIINVATQTEAEIIPDNVVSAAWAPNGLDFAYIGATPTTYELRWRTANGEDTLLAVDVPHSLRVSPDGRFVAFTRESHYELTAIPGLYIVEIATGIETQVSPLDRAGYGGTGLFWKPHWSPDSRQLFLYATADDDRADEPHDTGFAWAAADGSFSYFLPQSAFLTQFDEPLNKPDDFYCLDTPVLFAANMMVMGVGECPPMVGDPPISRPAVFTLDAQTGSVTLQQMIPAAESAQLLSWDVPGKSVLLQDGDQIVSYPLEETAE